MDEILTFDQMVDDPSCNGLCDRCPDVPFVLTPNGPTMCEGRSCDKAYEAYLLEYFNNPCHICKYADKLTPGRAIICDTCKHYNNWKYKGGDGQ